MHDYTEVDVFTDELLLGNPVAVVHDAEDLTDEQMAAFARWTNLSETAFLLPPTTDEADYRVRIFTPGEELPFAGHPTLGSARAWLAAGGRPATDGRVVQECGLGLITLRQDDDRLAFAAPQLLRSGPVDPDDLQQITAALRIPVDDVLAASWCDNGPGWVGLLLGDADAVLDLRPDWSAFADYKIGVIGPCRTGGTADYEVRAFCPQFGILEDPVTGSLNASLAQWLIGEGRAPERYVAQQGTAMKRRGRIHVSRDGDDIWVGGDCVIGVRGELDL
ncbi:PhzF family phenazine biosynthesis protein [Blastococcus sp. Marseille-P5729]|uniref:PhzF family phenazine biosynthesis protein n=1 Tax=Blastococcus sp. Marseille-P5729 TaxID=2086582 RepID=UPI000D10DB1A|nr:PhzF family phenazine biosynthesis protein [Blastococcus sp. Marseille-P5729]